ncbi:AAA family ATPase [Anaerosporobacter sp.]|uniref:AAA family ATPase n=1 Tax=Anaerosporobacter sp. TaxID=1872529 RepID=UPI00286F260A|nr:ATP-binding protein [Anaerosporobacter sp.]
MLIQFSVKNFMSFRDEAILDMTAINAYKEHEYNLIDMNTKERFLKVAAIYGANASGKSNLNHAFDAFRYIIMESFNNVEADKDKVIDIFYKPFLFEKNIENTEFQVIEIVDEYEYKYGFEYNNTCIVSEWLYRKNIKTNRNTIIFERTNEEINFGATVRKECESYKNQVPSETLVLSFFNKLKMKTDIFSIVYKVIITTMIMDSSLCEERDMIEKFLPNTIDKDKNQLLSFLYAIDTGIKDVAYKTDGKRNFFYTLHEDKEGNNYELPLYSESEGTVKSIIIYMYAKAAVLNNTLMFVDELNVKLHPLLLKFIIDLFYVKDSKAQLVYTTHDTTLLDKKFFRRDQIWFVEKDEEGCSKLNALSDYRVRSDASFEKDYLAGVYGGIPLLKEFSLEEGE